MAGLQELVFRKPLPPHVELSIVVDVGGKRLESTVADQFTVAVGEMGQHVAQSNVPILAVQWQILGGNPVAGYVVSQGLGQVLPVTPAALVANPLVFAFTTPGAFVVGVTIWTAYGSGFVSNAFQVTAPQVNFFDSQTVAVALQTYQGQPWIMFGSAPGLPGPPGITMNAVLYGQQSSPGLIGILQLATDQRTGTDADNNAYHNSQNGIAVLDVGPAGAYTFYQNQIDALPVGGNAQVIVDDAPGQQLGPPLSLVSIGDEGPGPETYQAFLMFCSDSPGSIWVPLSVLTWTWEGYTELQADGIWGPVQEPDNLENPAGVATAQFPTWTANTTTGGWAPGPGMRALAGVGANRAEA